MTERPFTANSLVDEVYSAPFSLIFASDAADQLLSSFTFAPVSDTVDVIASPNASNALSPSAFFDFSSKPFSVPVFAELTNNLPFFSSKLAFTPASDRDFTKSLIFVSPVTLMLVVFPVSLLVTSIVPVPVYPSSLKVDADETVFVLSSAPDASLIEIFPPVR